MIHRHHMFTFIMTSFGVRERKRASHGVCWGSMWYRSSMLKFSWPNDVFYATFSHLLVNNIRLFTLYWTLKVAVYEHQRNKCYSNSYSNQRERQKLPFEGSSSMCQARKPEVEGDCLPACVDDNVSCQKGGK